MEIQGARVWRLEMAGADTLYKLDETTNLCEQMNREESIVVRFCMIKC